jgi:hypothetical protein
VVGLCAALAACGAGDASSSESGSNTDDGVVRAIDVVASDVLANARAAEVEPADARCVAEIVVEAVGVERLGKLGYDGDAETAPELTVPPMTDFEGDRVYSAFDTCLDFTSRDVENFIAAGLTGTEARCASEHYRGSPLPRTHALLRNHDETPHEELHAQVEALWNEAQTRCRE